MRRCEICGLREDVPRMSIGGDGTCSFCESARKKTDRRYRGLEAMWRDVDALLQSAAKDRPYDCAVAFSGGRDSAFLMHLVGRRAGLRILAVSVTSDFTPPETLENIRSIPKALGIDRVELKNEWLNRQSRLCMKAWAKKPSAPMITTFCSGCRSTGQIISRYAKRRAIPIVFNGNAPYESITLKRDIIAANPDRPTRPGMAMGYVKQIARNPAYLRHPSALYRQGVEYLLSERFLKGKGGPKVIKPFRKYIEWKKEAIDAALEEIGWKAPEGFAGAHRSDCYISYLKSYFYMRMLGYSDLEVERANQVRHNILTKEEALEVRDEWNLDTLRYITERFYGLDFDLLDDRAGQDAGR